jgi:hypothetical protein
MYSLHSAKRAPTADCKLRSHSGIVSAFRRRFLYPTVIMARARLSGTSCALAIMCLLGCSAMLVASQQVGGINLNKKPLVKSPTPKSSPIPLPSPVPVTKPVSTTKPTKSPKPASPLPKSPSPAVKQSPPVPRPVPVPASKVSPSPKPVSKTSPSPKPTPAPRRKPSPKAGTYKPKIRALAPRTPAEIPFLVSVKPGSKTPVLAALKALGYKVKSERVPMGTNTMAVAVPSTIGLKVNKAASVSKAGVAAVTKTALAALKNIPGEGPGNTCGMPGHRPVLGAQMLTLLAPGGMRK